MCSAAAAPVVLNAEGLRKNPDLRTAFGTIGSHTAFCD